MTKKKDRKDYKYGKPCTDHLGKHYKTVEQMCLSYNIPPETYHTRMKRGWTLERALTTPPRNYKWHGKRYIFPGVVDETFDGTPGTRNQRVMAMRKRRAGVEEK